MCIYKSTGWAALGRGSELVDVSLELRRCHGPIGADHSDQVEGGYHDPAPHASEWIMCSQISSSDKAEEDDPRKCDCNHELADAVEVFFGDRDCEEECYSDTAHGQGNPTTRYESIAPLVPAPQSVDEEKSTKYVDHQA